LKKGNFFFVFMLSASLCANVYLFNLVIEWQEAWTEQIVTTSHVERLYTSSTANVSYEAVKELVGNEIGEYKIIPVIESDNMWAGGDKDAILVHGTKLFFKDGQYIGSKANLPEDLVHWRMGNAEKRGH